MASEAEFREVTGTLAGTTSAPHFDRTAFKVNRTYVTLAGDGLTAIFKFLPEEQELKCMVHPEAFTPVDNAWGKQGWTMCTLSELNKDELKSALEMAWQHAVPKKVSR